MTESPSLPATGVAQSSSAPAAVALPPNLPPQGTVAAPKPPFMIRSYEGAPEYGSTRWLNVNGKCLDYGTPPVTPTPSPIGGGAAVAAGLAVEAASRQNVKTVVNAAAPTAPSVFLNDCSQAHSIVVEELNNGRHEVVLHAGNQVIGISQPMVAYDASVSASPGVTPLRLFTPPTTVTGPETVNDVFALDGDSIILASSRCTDLSVCSPPPIQLVVQLQDGRSDNGTPLVVAPRNLSGSEFWDFLATDHSDTYPTGGFWAVSNLDDLMHALGRINQVAQNNRGTAWGNVIVVKNVGTCLDSKGKPAKDWAENPIPQCINLTGQVNNGVSLDIPTGVTIRGDRRGTNLGPLLLGQYNPISELKLKKLDTWMIKTGSYVRITGLRLEGPNGSTAQSPWLSKNITVQGILVESPATEVIIDHNELFAWPDGSIVPHGGLFWSNPDCANGQPSNFDPTSGVFSKAPPASVDSAHVERNFIHDNAAQSAGYGVVLAHGGGSTIVGNTFLYNRHDIAGDAIPTEQYSARNNLVLSKAPSYPALNQGPEQDFDMHGTGTSPEHGYGAWAGYHIEIAWNTFLGGNRENFELRGQPCHEPDSFHNNVTQDEKGNAIKEYRFEGGHSNPTSSDSEITITDNIYFSASPTNFLGVGDFDGDGVQDLFLATGTTWFYSPGGVTEWRYLSGGHTGNMQSLLLGDFDGDGRTDVMTINGNSLIVSWGGISEWQVLNTLPAGASIADFAVGDFNGDGHADILYTTGTYWYVSSGGSGPFNYVNKSRFLVPNLRFGHFSICGRNKETDVFGVVSGKWQVTCGAVGDWQPLPVSLTDSVSDLYVADFDGDENADVAQPSTRNTNNAGNLTSWAWNFSHDGAQGWVPHLITPTSGCPALGPNGPDIDRPFVAGIGSFDDKRGADILMWGGDLNFGNHLCIMSSGIGDARLQSRQEMR